MNSSLTSSHEHVGQGSQSEGQGVRASGEGSALRDCNNGDCGWSGTTDRFCGSIGPLCPDCGETTEQQ